MSTLVEQIRVAMQARITTAINFKSVRDIPVPPVQDDQLPALGVYLIRDTKNPDGVSNSGPPRYIADAVISVMVIQEAGRGTIDATVDLIETLLLRDPTFLDLRDAAENKPIIDSVPTVATTYFYPKEGEAQYVEARMAFTLRYFCYFPPLTPNDFKLYHATARPNGSDEKSPDLEVEFHPTPGV